MSPKFEHIIFYTCHDVAATFSARVAERMALEEALSSDCIVAGYVCYSCHWRIATRTYSTT